MDRDRTVSELVSNARAGTITRREFVGRLAAIGVAPAGIAALVAACGESRQAPPEPASSAAAAAPTSATAAETTASAAATTAAAGTSAPAEPTASSAAEGSTTAEVSAIPGPPWEGGVKGGEAHVGWPDEGVVYDPPVAYDFGGYYGLPNFYRGLLYPNLDGSPGLDLAESMDISDDAKRYVFRLKQGVTFHHGREAKAADFKYTFERSSSKEIASWVQAFLGSVEGHADFVAGKAKEISGIRTPDDYTIELVLTRPDVTIPTVLSVPPFYVLPQEEVERLGDQFTFNPVGTGPFKLDTFDQGASRYEASRFDDYIYADQLPYVDRLIWEWNVPVELESLRTERGELDSVGANVGSALSVVARLAKSEELKDQFHQWDSLYLVWFAFDVTKKPFDDKRVRQAFNLALNKDRLKALQINPTGHFYPPTLLGFDASTPTYEYDPERAKSLLAEAGYPDGMDIVLPILNSGPNAEGRWEQVLAQDLKAIGVNAELKKDAALATDLGPRVRDKYRLWAMNWGMGLPDPAELVNSLFGTNAPSNYGGYGNAQIDELGIAGQSEPDRAKRGEIYADIERLLIDDAPFLFMGVLQWYTLHSARVQNFVWEPVVWQHWDRYWLQS